MVHVRTFSLLSVMSSNIAALLLLLQRRFSLTESPNLCSAFSAYCLQKYNVRSHFQRTTNKVSMYDDQFYRVDKASGVRMYSCAYIVLLS